MPRNTSATDLRSTLIALSILAIFLALLFVTFILPLTPLTPLLPRRPLSGLSAHGLHCATCAYICTVFGPSQCLAKNCVRELEPAEEYYRTLHAGAWTDDERKLHLSWGGYKKCWAGRKWEILRKEAEAERMKALIEEAKKMEIDIEGATLDVDLDE